MKKYLAIGLFFGCGLLFGQDGVQIANSSILEQLLSIPTIVALCTGFGVIFTIYQNHKIKTNDLHHLEKYTVAIGKAVHALLTNAGKQDEAQKLFDEMSDAFTSKG